MGTFYTSNQLMVEVQSFCVLIVYISLDLRKLYTVFDLGRNIFCNDRVCCKLSSVLLYEVLLQFYNLELVTDLYQE